MPVLLGLVAILALVLANAYFVAAEFALVGARHTRLEEQGRAGDRKAILAHRAVQSLDHYISATQLGITLASLGLGWIGEPALARFIQSGFAWLPSPVDALATHSLAVAVAFAVITLLHIVLGELVPKAIALLYPETVSRWLIAPLIGFTWVMYLPIRGLNVISGWMLRVIGLKTPAAHERLHSPEELRLLVEQSTEGGRLEAPEARLLEGVFEFSEKTAEEVMTPRTRVHALEAETPVLQAADLVAQAGRSRYPVIHETLDDIVGVVHAKDILRAIRQRPDATVGTLMRPPIFVPGTRDVEDVLADMKRLKAHLAVVLDEYGGTAGLVTMEDLLEEIVGPIYDEHDRPEIPAVASENGAPVLPGSLPVADANERLGLALDERDYTTLGGYLFGQLGRLPAVGDRIAAGGRVFEITAMDGRRVDTVRVLDEPAKEPAHHA